MWLQIGVDIYIFFNEVPKQWKFIQTFSMQKNLDFMEVSSFKIFDNVLGMEDKK